MFGGAFFLDTVYKVGITALTEKYMLKSLQHMQVLAALISQGNVEKTFSIN